MNNKDFAELGNFICEGFIRGLKNGRRKEMNDKLCSNCIYNKYNYIDELYYCDNEHSDNYGVPTFYDDSCVDFEEA